MEGLSIERDAVNRLTRSQRIMWSTYAGALALFCWIAWRVHDALGGKGLEVWEQARDPLYGAAVVSGVAAILLRRRFYEQAATAYALEAREIVSAAHDSATGAPSDTRREALSTLADRERIVWTLCVGPTIVSVPAVLFSGDAAPFVPLVVASIVLLLLNFPRIERFTSQSGTS